MNASVSRLTGTAAKFLDDKKGAALALVAIAAVPIIASIGIASDVARGYLVKNRLTEAVDAASLAAGRQPDPALRQGDAERFFWANFGQDYLGTTVTSGPVVVSDADAGTVTVTAAADVPTSFMSAVGFDKVNVTARAVVNRQLNGMELILVMDNTGSMGNDGKIGAMRTAAKDLMQILYGSQQTIDDVWVGLVPYVTMVNVGDSHTNWLGADFDIADYNQDPRGWTGCVIARPGTGDRSDDPPTVADPIIHYFWDSDDDEAAWNDWYNRWPAVVTDEGAPWWSRDARGPNRGCVTPITSLNPYRDRVEAAIDLMQPHNYGGTMINVGLVWGWRAISPRWRGLWGGDTPATLPLDYDEEDMEKVIILLTDGMNVFNSVDYTAYQRREEGILGSTDFWPATSELNNRTAEVCAAVKAAGIRLYTITFQQNDPDVQNLMRSCSSEPHDEHYFDSPNNQTLVENFKLIAGKLSKLRVAE